MIEHISFGMNVKANTKLLSRSKLAFFYGCKNECITIAMYTLESENSRKSHGYIRSFKSAVKITSRGLEPHDRIHSRKSALRYVQTSKK